MKLPAVVMVALVFAGCMGDEDEPSRSPPETARDWVAAINEGAYAHACDLSVVDTKAECIDLLKREPFGEDLEIEGFHSTEDPDAEPTFGLSSREIRKPRGVGWTAYAPMDGFSVERDGGEYKVHFEASIIR